MPSDNGDSADSDTLVPIGRNVPNKSLLDQARESGYKALAKDADELAVPSWPSYSPRGSVGLFVRRGQASFCNVVIERDSHP